MVDVENVHEGCCVIEGVANAVLPVASIDSRSSAATSPTYSRPFRVMCTPLMRAADFVGDL
jgi:hypothetical protein